jgi:hypothetical protein
MYWSCNKGPKGTKSSSNEPTGYKAGRQVIGSEPLYISLLPYVFTVTAWKMVKIISSEAFLQSSKPNRSSYLDAQLSIRHSAMRLTPLGSVEEVDIPDIFDVKNAEKWSVILTNWPCVVRSECRNLSMNSFYSVQLHLFHQESDSWTKSRQKSSEFSILLFTVTSAALPGDFYFFKLTQPLTVSTFPLINTIKEAGGKPDRIPSQLLNKSTQKPQV